MRYIEISGGTPLGGSITVQGSKNAALPILTSCLLGEGECRIENCPVISDVSVTLRLLEAVGCKVIQEDNVVCVDASGVWCDTVPGGEASQIRSSVLFLGALTARLRRARLPLPGGCAIGARPVDLHIRALTSLGVRFEDEAQGILRADGTRLHGARISLPYPSVGATENAILASVLAPGVTRITGAAREPEIRELCSFLNLRGARIREKEGTIWIEGVSRLHPVRYRMCADRIVAGTYAMAAAAAGGRIRISQFPFSELETPVKLLRSMGVGMERQNDSCIVSGGRVRAVSCVETAPYPGFPTDLQSPLLALLTGADGGSCVRETVFENRFCAAGELAKMGARIRVRGDCAYTAGGDALSGAAVDAPDLRGGAALILAGLRANGLTRIGRIEYIERGYEDICRDMRQLGAEIKVVKDPENSGKNHICPRENGSEWVTEKT